MLEQDEVHFAELYREAQARKILRLFKLHKGRDVQSMNELSQWWAEAGLAQIEPDTEDFVEEVRGP